MKPHIYIPPPPGTPLSGSKIRWCHHKEDGQWCAASENAPLHGGTMHISNTVMTSEHYNHLEQLQQSFYSAVAIKYEAGVKQHGGMLWTKPGIIDKALEEVVDMYVFLYTLKMQQENPSLIDPKAKDIDEE